jgi:hypothetical protein
MVVRIAVGLARVVFVPRVVLVPLRSPVLVVRTMTLTFVMPPVIVPVLRVLA